MIGEENGKQSYVTWKIEALNDNSSKLTITVYPFILAKLPKIFAIKNYILNKTSDKLLYIINLREINAQNLFPALARLVNKSAFISRRLIKLQLEKSSNK